MPNASETTRIESGEEINSNNARFSRTSLRQTLTREELGIECLASEDQAKGVIRRQVYDFMNITFPSL